MKKFLCIAILFVITIAIFTSCKENPTGSSQTSTQTTPLTTAATTTVTTTDNDIQQILAELGLPESYMVERENYFDYQENLECSAFSSAYVMRHYGEEADGVELFKTFPDKIPNEGGAYPSGVELFFSNSRYSCTFETHATTIDLMKELIKGAPVIVFIHVEEPYESVHNTHYVPLVGYDKEYFYFAESLSDYANCKDEEGLSYNRKTKIDKFKRLWDDNIDGVFSRPYFSIVKKPAIE